MLIGHGYTQSLRAQYVLRVVTCRVFTWNSWLFQRRICQIHKPLFPSWYVLEKTKPVYQKILTNKKPWPGFLRFWIISSGVKLLEVVLASSGHGRVYENDLSDDLQLHLWCAAKMSPVLHAGRYIAFIKHSRLYLDAIENLQTKTSAHRQDTGQSTISS